MRARTPNEYAGAPKLKGDKSDDMNSMFDTKGAKAEQQ